MMVVVVCGMCGIVHGSMCDGVCGGVSGVVVYVL